MENSVKKIQVEGGDKEILYSKTIKAGKRIYYLDVKKNLKDDLFLAGRRVKKCSRRMVCRFLLRNIRFFCTKKTLTSSWME